MKIYRSAMAALALTSALTQAEVPQSWRAPLPMNFASTLDLDRTRALVVEAILENAQGRILAAREQIGPPTDETTRAVMQAALQAICGEADKQLASVLTGKELARLKELMAQPPTAIQRALWNPL
jgi:hypothetical protein